MSTATAPATTAPATTANASPETRRESALLSAVDKFLDTHLAWVDSAEKLLTEDYEDSIRELFDAFETGSLPANCRKLAVAVDDLSDEWDRYESNVTQLKPMPGEEFWASVEQVRGERRGAVPEERKPLESVAYLKSTGVTPQQIAVIYSHMTASGVRIGPFMRNGIPQVHLVLQELEKPGSIITEGWTHPADEERLSRAQKVESQRIARMEERRAPAKPCPESIEELLRQSVFPQQIAAMHGVTLTTVLNEAKRLGIKPEKSAEEVLREARFHNPMIPDTEQPTFAPPEDSGDSDGSIEGILEDDSDEDGVGAGESGDGEGSESSDPSQSSDSASVTAASAPESVEDRIAALSAEGKSAVEISKLVGESVQKVAGVIRARRRAAEQAGS